VRETPRASEPFERPVAPRGRRSRSSSAGGTAPVRQTSRIDCRHLRPFSRERAPPPPLVGADATLQWDVSGLGSRLAKVNAGGCPDRSGGAAPGHGSCSRPCASTWRTSRAKITRPPHTISDLLYKRASRTGRGRWKGMIRVEKDAPRPTRTRRTHNLVLSDAAARPILPGLRSRANDVRCTHGATSRPRDERHDLLPTAHRAGSPPRPRPFRLDRRGFFSSSNVYDRITVEPRETLRQLSPTNSARRRGPLRTLKSSDRRQPSPPPEHIEHHESHDLSIGPHPTMETRTSLPKSSLGLLGRRAQERPQVAHRRRATRCAAYAWAPIPGSVKNRLAGGSSVPHIVRDYINAEKSPPSALLSGIAGADTHSLLLRRQVELCCPATHLRRFKLFGHKICRVMNAAGSSWSIRAGRRDRRPQVPLRTSTGAGGQARSTRTASFRDAV